MYCFLLIYANKKRIFLRFLFIEIPFERFLFRAGERGIGDLDVVELGEEREGRIYLSHYHAT
jgi:hypothetical protein